MHSIEADDVRANSQESEFEVESVNETDKVQVRANSRNSLGIIEEISGRSKRKRVRRETDALNGCLCGKVLDNLSEGVLKCNQANCETQWVSSIFTL